MQFVQSGLLGSNDESPKCIIFMEIEGSRFKVVSPVGIPFTSQKSTSKIDLELRFLPLVCAEMRGCATHLACLILPLLLND